MKHAVISTMADICQPHGRWRGSMARGSAVEVVELHWLLQMGEELAALWLYAVAEKLKNVQKTDLNAKHTNETG